MPLTATVHDWLADEIRRRKPTDRPVKVGIDGRCGAGKTIFADALAPLLRAHGLAVLRPSIDGFHHPREYRYRQGEYSATGYYEDAFDTAAIQRELLDPLSEARFPVQCRHVWHDVRTDVPIGTTIDVQATTVLLFDGVFLFRPELNLYWDLRVLLHVDAETSIKRAVARDSAQGLGSVDLVRQKYDRRYEPAWLLYRDIADPDAKADVIIENGDFIHPRFLKGGPRPS